MTLPALVLTAGLGTRLDPLTRERAKPAVPMGDCTLIERVLRWLRSQGVRDLVLNLHHRPQTITEVVGDGAHLGVSVRYSWEEPLLGSAGGPRRALPILAAETFVIVNGDTLCDLDLPSMIAAHEESGADVTLAVVPNTAPDRYNGIVVDANGVARGFVPRGAADGSWHFVGVQVVRAKVFEALADGVPAETIAGIYRDRVAATPGTVRTWRTNAAFIDVGTPRDYVEAALRYPQAVAADGDLAGSTVVRSVVWPGASIGANAHLEGCVVMGGARVPHGFRARSAVLAPATLAVPGDRAAIHDGLAVFPL